MRSMDRGGVVVALFHLHFHLLLLMMILVAMEEAYGRISKTSNEALSLFREKVDAHGQLSVNWSGQDACSGQWMGVGCSSSSNGTGTGRIISLSLPNLQLRGTLGPATLSRLFHLRMLDLRNNRLNGTIQLLFSSDSDSDSDSDSYPKQLVYFTRLRLLYLSGNDLSGPIPIEGALGQLSRLVRLDLSDNNLSGPIPSSFSSSSLLTLRLQDNLLTGSLPDLTSALPLLQQFNASNNRLYGTLPPAMLHRFGISAFQGNTHLYYLCGPNNYCNIHSSPAISSSVVPSNPSSNSSTGNEKEIVGGGGTRRSRAIVLISIGNGIFLLLVMLFLSYLFCSSSTHFGAGKDHIGKVGAVEEEEEDGTYPHPLQNRNKKNNNNESSENESDAAASAAEERQSKLVFFQQEEEDHKSSDSRREFGLEELLGASAEMLGKGSLGSVYRAVLEDGSMVAVKRLKDANPCRRIDFHKYMDLIGRLNNHPNIVPLKAYYFAKQEKLLVYPYIPNGNLYTLLHGN